MEKALLQFNENLKKVCDLGGIANAVGILTHGSLDLSDLLRAQVVFTVSALDQVVHEFIRVGIIESFSGIRVKCDLLNRRFSEFQVIDTQTEIGISELNQLDARIRELHSYKTFQRPKKIAEGFSLISKGDIWEKVAKELNFPEVDIVKRLELIVDRRNKIAHEADLDPVNPGFRWPIDSGQIDETVAFIDSVAKAMYNALKT